MTLDEKRIAIRIARDELEATIRKKGLFNPDPLSGPGLPRRDFGEVSDNLSLLHWFWNDPDGQLYSLTDEGQALYRAAWRTALRSLKERRRFILEDGIFYKFER